MIKPQKNFRLLLILFWFDYSLSYNLFFPTLVWIFLPPKLQILFIRNKKAQNFSQFWKIAYSSFQGIIDKSAEVTQLQIDLIEAFKVQHPLPLEENSISINSRRDGSPMYNSAQPEVTEEQTVTIPGEEDLPARTPTPELLGN